MKKLMVLLLFLLFPVLSWADCTNQPYGIYLSLLNSNASSYICDELDEIGSDAIFIYDYTDHYAYEVHIGSGLSYNHSTKTLSASSSQFNLGDPTTRTLSVSTAYQANDPPKAALITLSPTCPATLNLTTGQTCTLTARVSSTTPTCSTGTAFMTWTNGNTGALTIGLGLTQTVGSPGTIPLGVGRYFILCATSGTFTLGNIMDQTAQ